MGRIKSMKNFRQADSRWGYLSYKDLPYKLATNGCGPTACADIISSNPKYKNITPKKTRAYMIKKGYAVNGAGTAWNGISSCLTHYGFNVLWHSTMKDFFKEMSKGGRRAMLLFKGGTKGGITWTTGGHYVSVSGCKVKNGKHYLYTLDPGFRHNDGWHCYETSMRGLIINCWTATLPKKKTTKKKETKPKEVKKTTKPKTTKKVVSPSLPKRGYFKLGDKGVNVKRLQTLLSKLKYSFGAIDGVYGEKTEKAIKRFQKKNKLKVDGKVGKKTLAAIKKTIK